MFVRGYYMTWRPKSILRTNSYFLNEIPVKTVPKIKDKFEQVNSTEDRRVQIMVEIMEDFTTTFFYCFLC